MNNTAGFEFNLGDMVIDNELGGTVEVIGRFRQHGFNQYECKKPDNYIIYRSENDLTK